MNDMSIYDKFSGPFNDSLTGQSAAETVDHGLFPWWSMGGRYSPGTELLINFQWMTVLVPLPKFARSSISILNVTISIVVDGAWVFSVVVEDDDVNPKLLDIIRNRFPI